MMLPEPAPAMTIVKVAVVAAFVVALVLGFGLILVVVGDDAQNPGDLPRNCAQGHQEVHDGVKYGICDRYRTTPRPRESRHYRQEGRLWTIDVLVRCRSSRTRSTM